MVDTDEKVRKELYRKPRVEQLREKNHEELQKSFTKLKNSLSPGRGNNSSPYRSAYFD
jgi:ribosomal protein L29